jgi:guanylate kinase
VNQDNLNPVLHNEPAVPLLVVISGPSGVGKDTVLMRMREFGMPFHFVVTTTSRSMRPGEVEGFDYHFVSKEHFEDMIANDDLLEHAVVYGEYKGIPKSQVRNALRSGKDVIMRIDVQGAATIRQLAPEAVLIFLIPPSTAELASRLRLRRTESPEALERRLALAEEEMQRVHEFDYVVMNPEARPDEAASAIQSIIRAEKARIRPRRITL